MSDNAIMTQIKRLIRTEIKRLIKIYPAVFMVWLGQVVKKKQFLIVGIKTGAIAFMLQLLNYLLIIF